MLISRWMRHLLWFKFIVRILNPSSPKWLLPKCTVKNFSSFFNYYPIIFAEFIFKCIDSSFKKSLPKCFSIFFIVILSSSLSKLRASNSYSINLSFLRIGGVNLDLVTDNDSSSLFDDLYLFGVFFLENYK